MTQCPINPGGGAAPVVVTRMDRADLAQVARLACRRKVSRSAIVRELLAHALDALERGDTGPPGRRRQPAEHGHDHDLG